MDQTFCDVSVIIPAYNVQDYLADSLASLRNQTLPPKEIIVVDDCSTDSTLKVAESWEKRLNDSGIDLKIVALGKNQGAGNARNEGIDRATGRYLYFLDADDISLGNLFEDFQSRQDADPTDLHWFSAETIYAADLSEVNSYRPTYRMISHGAVARDEALARVREVRGFNVNVFLYIFDRKILGDLRFLSHNCHEDEAFTVSLLSRARTIQCSPKSYVQRRIRPDSIMTREKSQYNADSYLACADALARDYVARTANESGDYPKDFVKSRLKATIDLGRLRWQKSTLKLALRLLRAEPLVRRLGLRMLLRHSLERYRASNGRPQSMP